MSREAVGIEDARSCCKHAPSAGISAVSALLECVFRGVRDAGCCFDRIAAAASALGEGVGVVGAAVAKPSYRDGKITKILRPHPNCFGIWGGLKACSLREGGEKLTLTGRSSVQGKDLPSLPVLLSFLPACRNPNGIAVRTVARKTCFLVRVSAPGPWPCGISV